MNQTLFMKHRAKKAPMNNRTYAPCFQFCSFYKTGGAARYFRNKNEQLRQRTFTPPFSVNFIKSFIILHSSFIILNSSSFILHSSFFILNSSFREGR